MRIYSEADVLSCMTMDRAVTVLETAARDMAEGKAANEPRVRLKSADRMLHILPAGSERLRAMGLKTYVSGPGKPQFWYLLYGDAGLRAMLEADNLGRIRTGAATALATRALAAPDADVLAIFGTGSQAMTQIGGVHAVRSLRDVRVVARNAERAAAFAHAAAEEFGIPVRVCAAAEALAGARIVVTITSAKEPLFAGGLVEPGTHVNAVGSNRPTHREIDDALLSRCSRVVVEDVEQARREAGDLLRADGFDWARVETLASVIAAPSRERSGDVTLFESLGIGMWDLALADDVVSRSET